MRYQIILTGVGGQGLISMGRILGEVLLERGFKVRVAEVHGLAQRGGSVIVHVKYGDEDLSPTIPRGNADLIISLELLEAARNISYLRRGGTLIVNDLILPPPAAAEIPSRSALLSFFEKLDAECFLVEASEAARRLGSALFTNTVMLGVLAESGLLNLDPLDLERSLHRVITRFLEKNIEAFRQGRKLWLQRKRL